MISYIKNINLKNKVIYYSLILAILFFYLSPNSLQAKYKKRSIPKSRTLKFQNKYYKLFLYAKRFAQGDGVYFKMIAKKKTLKNPRIKFLGSFVPMTKQKRKGVIFYDGLLGISPAEKVGKKKIRVYYYPPKSKGKVYAHYFKVRKTKFLVKHINLKINKKYTKPPKKTYALIAKLLKIKRKAFRKRTARKWNGRFIDARNLDRITSPFYTIRYYNGKPGRPHSGVDLRGRKGAPIRAMNSGRVLIARKFYYEGNFTLIDHGEGIFTIYMHQSKLYVHKGDMVKRGQLIGLSGSTGMVTGPHLHLGLKIKKINYEPLSFLALPIIKH